METEKTNYVDNYFAVTSTVIEQVNRKDIEDVAHLLAELKKSGGRLFLLGVGGSAANCSHAVNDFRKICHIEAYAPTDNVAELTARTNDDGWETIFSSWLEGSHLTPKDVVMVLSVGGGNVEKNISTNIVKALEFAIRKGSPITGIVSRDGGYTRRVARASVLIPVSEAELITPVAESFQAVIWHLLVNHPLLTG
mgnify:CR=1 FL=1